MNEFNKNKNKGFTLLELLLVVSILAIFATLSRDFYGGYVKGVALEANAKNIVSDLRTARDKAMNGENDQNWGVHFINTVGNTNDYYEIFSSPTIYANASTTVLETNYLRDNIIFFSPASGINKDILFSKINATTTVDTINLATPAGDQKSVSVSAIGMIE